MKKLLLHHTLLSVLLLLLSINQALTQNFITRWDLSKGSSSTRILFHAVVVDNPANYTWQEISPGASTGSGSIPIGNDLFILSNLPIGATIRLSIEPTNLKGFSRGHFLPGNEHLIDIEAWGTAKWASMHRAFQACRSLKTLTATDTPNLTEVTDMSHMFDGATNFNHDISNWNTENVTNMRCLFYGATFFNQPIGSWNTEKVTDMSSMFSRTQYFNQPIGNWNTASVTDMTAMFSDAHAFNQPIENWNTSSVTDMRSIFDGASSFNQPIENWNTSNVTSMKDMFRLSKAFNQPLGKWNTSNVTNMYGMFEYSSSFNQPIEDWNTAKVVTMGYMFSNTESFNQNINKWNTEMVRDMSYMFAQARAFNQPLGNWHTTNVIDMSYMFSKDSNFNQNIGNFTLNANVDMKEMLTGNGMDCANYSNTLIGWNTNNPSTNNKFLNAEGRTYDQAGNAARNNLINRGWTILGDTPCTTSSNLLPETAIQVFPNPATTELFFNGIEERTEYHIFNIFGSLSQQGILDNGNNSINIQNLYEGIYSLKMKGKVVNFVVNKR